jgi:hypothetical protein
MGLLHDLDDGKKREITEDQFDYFLEVLPPVAMPLLWKGERWAFGFAEGYDYVYAFRKERGRYFARKTDLLNPYECGHSIADQQKTPGFVERLGQEKEATRAARWIPTWLRVGRADPRMRDAADPPFDTRSFHACLSDDELLDRLANTTGSPGQAFYRGETCVIRLGGGDEWLVVNRDMPAGTVAFGRVLRDQGRDAARATLDRIRTATVPTGPARDG